MKLLLDEMFSPAIARALREQGHDVQALQEHQEWRGLPDVEVVAVARAEQRAIVTMNLRDFRPVSAELLAEGGPRHAGMVFVPTKYRLSNATIGQLVRTLEAVLRAHPDETALASAEVWL